MLVAILLSCVTEQYCLANNISSLTLGKVTIKPNGTTNFDTISPQKNQLLLPSTSQQAERIVKHYAPLISNYQMQQLQLKVSAEDFINPPTIYRPLRILHTPPPDSVLVRLKQLGYGGIVTNVSYKNYLNDSLEWRYFNNTIANTIDSLKLRVWIYDEAGYPSGSAGGDVLKKMPGLEAVGLSVITRHSIKDSIIDITLPHGHTQVVNVQAVREDTEKQDVVDLRPYLHSSGHLRWKSPDNGWTVYYFAAKPFYENTHATNNWFAMRRMVNMLEPATGNAFIEATHEKYKKNVGNYFGRGIEAFFTDEPSMVGVHFIENKPPVTPMIQNTPDTLVPIYPTMNWSRDLPFEFRNRRGYDLLPEMHCLIGHFSPHCAKVRVDFYTTLNELVVRNYFKPLQDFGNRNNIASSGHLLLEEELFYHPVFQGNIMQVYRHMQYPGIDLLTAFPATAKEWGVTTAKFASSIANQYHRPHVMSEISNAFDSNEAGIDGRLASIGVQFAFGVDHFNSYYEHEKMSQAENRLFTNYIGRVGYLLSEGQRSPQIDIYYPIESIYAVTQVPFTLGRKYFSQEAVSLSDNFKKLALNLVNKQVDFDYVDEQHLLETVSSEKVLVIPSIKIINKKLIDKLTYYASRGGWITFQQKEVLLFSPGQSEPENYDLAHHFTGYSNVFFASSLEQLVDWAIQKTVREYQLDKNQSDFVVLQKKGTDHDTYLMVNTDENKQRVNLLLYQKGQEIKVWDPVSGSVKKVYAKKTKGTKPEYSIPLTFKKWQTLLITVSP